LTCLEERKGEREFFFFVQLAFFHALFLLFALCFLLALSYLPSVLRIMPSKGLCFGKRGARKGEGRERKETKKGEFRSDERKKRRLFFVSRLSVQEVLFFSHKKK